MAEHLIKVHIKSLPYQPRGKAGEYRAGSVQVLEATEAYELESAGIATIVEDPYAPAEASTAVPYLQETSAPVDSGLPENYGDGADAGDDIEDEE